MALLEALEAGPSRLHRHEGVLYHRERGVGSTEKTGRRGASTASEPLIYHAALSFSAKLGTEWSDAKRGYTQICNAGLDWELFDGRSLFGATRRRRSSTRSSFRSSNALTTLCSIGRTRERQGVNRARTYIGKEEAEEVGCEGTRNRRLSITLRVKTLRVKKVFLDSFVSCPSSISLQPLLLDLLLLLLLPGIQLSAGRLLPSPFQPQRDRFDIPV